MKQPTEYQLWKEGHYLTLRAYTEEEIFNFGYEAGVATASAPKEDITGSEIVHKMSYPSKEQKEALDELYESTKELEEIIEEPKIPKNSKKK